MLHRYEDTDSFQFYVIGVNIQISLMLVYFTRKIHFTLLQREACLTLHQNIWSLLTTREKCLACKF